MKLHHLLISGAVVVMTAASAAAAQETARTDATRGTSGTVLVEVADEKLVVMPFNLTAEQVSEMEVYGSAGEKIGGIDDVLMKPGGSIVAVSVEASGFLGLGGREVIFGTENLTLDAGRFVTSLSREEIEALPDWGN